MSRAVIVDSGPLVALFNERDKHHAWVVEIFKNLRPPLYTCEPVIAESMYLLDKRKKSIDYILESIEKEVLVVRFSLEKHIDVLMALRKKYRNLPMSLADACLVRMSETISDSVVLTLDSDFRVYRRHGRRTIPLIAPEA